jgi:hypothetical protein
MAHGFQARHRFTHHRATDTNMLHQSSLAGESLPWWKLPILNADHQRTFNCSEKLVPTVSRGIWSSGKALGMAVVCQSKWER